VPLDGQDARLPRRPRCPYAPCRADPHARSPRRAGPPCPRRVPMLAPRHRSGSRASLGRSGP
jgi:hypothetical protein